MVAQGRVLTVRVIPCFDVVEDAESSFRSSRECLSLDQFAFERRKEGVGHRIGLFKKICRYTVQNQTSRGPVRKRSSGRRRDHQLKGPRPFVARQPPFSVLLVFVLPRIVRSGRSGREDARCGCPPLWLRPCRSSAL